MRMKGYRLEISLNLREQEVFDNYGSPVMEGQELPADANWRSTSNAINISDFLDLGNKDFGGALEVLTIIHDALNRIRDAK